MGNWGLKKKQMTCIDGILAKFSTTNSQHWPTIIGKIGPAKRPPNPICWTLADPWRSQTNPSVLKAFMLKAPPFLVAQTTYVARENKLKKKTQEEETN